MLSEWDVDVWQVLLTQCMVAASFSKSAMAACMIAAFRGGVKTIEPISFSAGNQSNKRNSKGNYFLAVGAS